MLDGYFGQVVSGGSTCCVLARYALNIFVRPGGENLHLYGGVGRLALSAFDSCQKLTFGADGLISHVYAQ